MPRADCTIVAVAGKVRSGVEVASTIASRSSGTSPASASAARAASVAMLAVVSSSAAMWRRSMPERERIHSSVVSSVASNSELGITRAGR